MSTEESLLHAVTTDYHNALNGPQALADGKSFLAHLVNAKISYGGRQLCPFLRPKFITYEQRQLITTVCHVLRGAIVKAKHALLANEELFHMMALTEGEKQLASIEPGYRSIGVSTRLDSFLYKDELKFVELNAECPAGVAFSDAMQDEFTSYAPLHSLRDNYRISGFDTRAILLGHLLDTYREWGGRTIPNIAVIDWREVSTRNEFELSADFFNRRGVPTIVCDPRDVEFVGGKLTVNGKVIDLVYRRVLTNDVLDRPDECKALVEAYRAHAVCVVNSFRAKILHKKMLFAVLHEPRVFSRYSPAEREIVRNHIPWTCNVAEGHVEGPDGSRIDLTQWISKNREDLVLKPNDEYGGKGVIVGHTVDQTTWEDALKTSLTQSSVVQVKVNLPTEVFPAIGRDNLGNECIIYEPRYVDLDPYLFRGEVGGILTRLSATSLCNVTAGGGSVPTFVAEPLR
jgi:hypothetical protein